MAEFGACVVQTLFTFAVLIHNFLDQTMSVFLLVHARVIVWHEAIVNFEIFLLY
jgi:hypothetical protein